jgi:hypothetical protein
VKRTSPKPSTTPAPLPKPNVEFAVGGDTGEMTPEKVRSLFCNPLYAGFGPFPALIDDEIWVRAAAHAIREHGPEQFLVNMLYVLRKSYETLKTDPDES